MSKNLTRKGLALGAIVALGASLFAGAPAQANTSGVLLAPATGTTNGMISGEAFTLQATIGSLIPSSSYGQLKFEVTNASGLTVTTVLTQTGSSADTDLSSSTLTTAQVVRSTTANVTGGANTTLAVSTAAADAGTVSVNAWLDADGDHAIDAGEIASGPQVITFVKPADVTWTTTLAQPFVGDTKQTVVVKSDKNINLDQVKAKVQVAFATLSGSTYTALTGTTMPSNGTFTVGETTTFVSADNSLKAELTNTALASTTYVAQAVWTTGTAELGSESAKAVAAATITGLSTPSITAGDDLAQASAVITARNGISSLTLTSQAYLTGTTVKAAAGQSVTVKITEKASNANTDAAKFVAGGKTLQDTTAGSDSIEFTVTTDATGLISIPVTVSGTVAGTDSITVAISAQSANAVSGGSLTTTVNFADATVANGALVDANQIGSGAIYKKVAGSTTTLKFAAKDSFGKGLGSTYRVLLTESGSSPAVIKDAVFSNGIASFSVADSATVSEVYSAQLQSYSSSTLTWSNGSFTPAVSVTPVIGASAAVGSVDTLVGSVTSGLVLNLNDLKAVDTRSGGTAPTVVSSGNIATLSGTVLDANGIPTYGDVTLSATGAMFETNGVYALGSITVQTNNSGAFGGVKIYSNTAGKTTVTATSNGKTKTLDLTFADAAVTTGSTYSLVAPTFAAPGSTLTVTPTITDKYGNKVAQTANFTFAYSGPGLPINANATTTANTAFRVLLGAGDSGTATVTWTVDKNNDNDTTDTGEIVTATITIGAAPVAGAVARVVGSTNRFFVGVNGNSLARNVVVKVAGRTFATLKGSATNRSYAVRAPKGSHKVTVFVGGKLIGTRTISVR